MTSALTNLKNTKQITSKLEVHVSFQNYKLLHDEYYFETLGEQTPRGREVYCQKIYLEKPEFSSIVSFWSIGLYACFTSQQTSDDSLSYGS